jgi:hypothetical protein
MRGLLEIGWNQLKIPSLAGMMNYIDLEEDIQGIPHRLTSVEAW